MVNQEIWKKLYAVVEPVISTADPAALGGADGEYDNQVNQICKYIDEHFMVSGAILQEMFTADFPHCGEMAKDDFSNLANEINRKVGEFRGRSEGS